MAKAKSTKKQSSKSKKNPQQSGRKSSIVEELRQNPNRDKDIEIFMRLVIAEYLLGKKGEGLSNDEKAERRKKLAKELGRTEQTLKNMYRSGQGSLTQFSKAMDFILATSQESIITFYKLYPHLLEKLEALDPAKRRLYHLIEKMTSEEADLVAEVVKVGFEKNRATKEAKKAIKLD